MPKVILPIFLLLWIAHSTMALAAPLLEALNIDTISKTPNDTVYPTFLGGDAALFKYLNSNIKYPKISKEKGEQGMAIIGFEITELGYTTNIKVLQSSGFLELDEEAMRVVAFMPKWNPGTINGIPLNVFYNLPIRFTLSGGNQKLPVEPPGEFSYKITFSNTLEEPFPRSYEEVKIAETPSYIISEFTNLPLKRHNARIEIYDSTGQGLLKTNYRFKPKDYDYFIYFQNYLDPNFQAGKWLFKFYLNDSLYAEEHLNVLPADSGYVNPDFEFLGLSAGLQLNRYKVLELNYIFWGFLERKTPSAVSFNAGAEINLDQKMYALKVGFVGSYIFSFGLHLKQFADFRGNNSFGIQPEIGFGYRLFNLSYGYNLQFLNDFPNINRNFIVARMGIRVKKVKPISQF